jgi:protein LSM14
MGQGHFPPQQMPPGPPGQRGPMPPPQGPGVPTPLGSAAPLEDPQPFAKPEDKGSAAAKVPGSSGTPIPLQEAPSSTSPGGSVPEGKAEAVQGKAPATGPKSNRIVPAVPLAKGVPPTNGSTMSKSVEDANREARAAVAAAMAKLPAAQGQKSQADDTMDNLSKKVSEMRTNEYARGGRGGLTGGYRGRGSNRGAGRGQGTQHGQKIEIPTTDYDFDAANAKFNKQDLVKEAIASGSPITTPSEETSGEALMSSANGTRKGSDSGLGAAGPSYNRSTSFFDDISSEIKDRAEIHDGVQRRGGREFRHEERQKNMETFGQGSVDNGYRYRGRGRGRGRGGFSRGRAAPRGGRGRGAPTAADA